MQGSLQRVTRWIGRERPAHGEAVALALACVAAATLVRLLFQPVLGEGYPFLTYFLGVILAAALGGLLAGGTALAASLLTAWYVFLPPELSFSFRKAEDVAALLFVAVTAGLSGLIAAALRRTLAELMRAEGRQQLLINELNHRVKNTLATVQSLALQTARASRSPEEFQPLFASRLAALSSAHDLLSRRNWEGAELGALLEQVVRPYDPTGGRVRAEGPKVALSPNAAVTTSLALHELTTNAVKHGALGVDEGRVDVRWSLDAGALDFEWRESGLAGLEPPTRQGFGARLLRAAARELEAQVTSDVTPQGLAYRWRIPLSGKVRRV